MAEIGLVSHARKVCSLYKRALRNLEVLYDDRLAFRYRATLLRARFDAHKDIKDMREAKNLLQQGENELFLNQHYQPKFFPNSPGGVAFEREVVPLDWVLDYWHPIEKAQYPDYFKRREERKKEYIAWWTKKYGPPTEEDLGVHH